MCHSLFISTCLFLSYSSPPLQPFYLHDSFSHASLPSLLHNSLPFSPCLVLLLYFLSTALSATSSPLFLLSISSTGCSCPLLCFIFTRLFLSLFPIYKTSELGLLGNSNTLISCELNMLVYRTCSLHYTTHYSLEIIQFSA